MRPTHDRRHAATHKRGGRARLAKLRKWTPRDWQLEREIAAAKAATLDNEYEQIEHRIAEQNARITKLIAAAEAALKEHP